ncbi:putative oxidoreductase (putative) [Lactiplantibacillus paraplantarum]|uniref:Short-chain dehydrogenase n=1 Tax=Lactiplantibacillus paraplantarum TaxID=60520 RepID=A0AAD0TRC4_9LACO|nr:NAD(P)H-binding protein [Lactiplantibacillus paraplantarum]AVW10057.1 short-chain dehydrogenase [Lactiplantibacillus paraplantarum]AYJ38306.1 short-chain dehydrogenase [Lactiplantibacillus paraplantarum]ERL44299.1 putative oxidoreductase (putative) [Lactiplantibacillus paraplantarum]KRL49925.1 NAD-dependent epimerase dehydratase [Lactiplantibacillus paraplantarum DSM 10667]MCU4683316.1 NAD(P)H-binding protein [Lactiplantibacillus paraplantarum]
MTNVLILGANGRIARIAEQRLLAETEVQLTLVLRHSERLNIVNPEREQVVEGDVTDSQLLEQVMPDQDIVYANLAGNMELLAKNIVQVMLNNQVKKLIWITGSGLYHETPAPFGSWVEQVVGHASKEDTRRAARIIESSALQYTIIRAAYMTDDSKVDYEVTQKGETFKGTMVSRASIADLVLQIVSNPCEYARTSLGIAQPGTDDMLPQIKLMERNR